MRLKNIILSLLLISLFVATSINAGEIKMTTYYPAPYGEYKAIKTTNDTYLATTNGSRVGIGTTNPQTIFGIGGNATETISKEGNAGRLGIAGSSDAANGSYMAFSGSNYTGTGQKTGGAEIVVRDTGNLVFQTYSPVNATNTTGHPAGWVERFLMWGGSGDIVMAHSMTYPSGQPAQVVNYAKVGIGETNLTGKSRLTVKGWDSAAANSTFECLNKANTSLLFVRDDGRVGLGTKSPLTTLEVNTTTGGFIPPRMNTTQRNSLTPGALPPWVNGTVPASTASMYGMVIFNTDESRLNVFNGRYWDSLTTGGEIYKPKTTSFVLDSSLIAVSDPDLNFAMGPGEIWNFEIVVPCVERKGMFLAFEAKPYGHIEYMYADGEIIAPGDTPRGQHLDSILDAVSWDFNGDTRCVFKVYGQIKSYAETGNNFTFGVRWLNGVEAKGDLNKQGFVGFWGAYLKARKISG